MDILSIEDFIVSNLLLPLGSLVFVLFCTNRFGWGFDNFIEEANTGKGIKIRPWMKGYMRFALPVIVGILLAYGVVSPFVR